MYFKEISLRVGLNATCFNKRSSGAKQRFVGIYLNLIKRMPNSIFVIYEPSNYNMHKYFDNYKNILIKKTPINSESHFSKIITGYFFWTKELKKEKFDIFEFFNLPHFYVSNCKTLMTIHDIRGMHNEYNYFGTLFYKFILSNSIKNADKIITVSQFMKNDILKYYHNANISVINNGISISDFKNFSDKDSDNVIENLHTPSNFLLSVGHFEKRKNFSNLITAFAKVKLNHADLSLIIIGNDSDEKKDIKQIINYLNLNDSVILLEGLSDFEVRYLYKKSKLFVFPSLYEGFGIPILESMASGCPIILSNIDVFKDITQNKCTYFDPLDPISIANTIEKYLNDPYERSLSIEYGYKRIQDFDYEKIADEVKSLYISIINK